MEMRRTIPVASGSRQWPGASGQALVAGRQWPGAPAVSCRLSAGYWLATGYWLTTGSTGYRLLVTGYWRLTLSNVHVAADPVVWLVTPRPTKTVVPIGILSVPTSVQFTPSADS